MNLPVLSPQFFKDHPPSMEFFQKWQGQFLWKDTILPLYEWDGILFIACNNLPETLPPGINCVFVQAQTEDLKNLWKAYHQDPKSNSSSELLEGLNLPQTPSSSVATDSIEGLDLSQVSGNTQSDSDDFFSQIQSVKTTVQSDSFSIDQLETSSNLTLTEARQNDPTEPEMIEGLVAEKPSQSSQTSQAIQDTQTTQSEVVDLSESTPPAYIETTSSWFTDIFDQLCTHYQKAMILLVDPNQAKPWKWSLNFTHAPGEQSKIELKTPSPFKIAAKTMKSYHGYLPDNPITAAFLKEWNNGQKPEHATLAPIIISDHTVGILLGIGDSSCYTKEHLQLSEKLALSIAQLIQKDPESLKAA
ncbi:MAG: hypothetical protein BroJett040_21300 [Oligoflexia bacterium]|nr:MAG: hypothetical protein BroJett040_21300 [Oligoflexia bacterium]